MFHFRNKVNRLITRLSCLVVVGVVFISCAWATNERISVTNLGFQANQDSIRPDISADGRYVVFDSEFAFVTEDTNGTSDVYIRDTVLNTTELVSWNSTNTGAGNFNSRSPSISANGRYVAFSSNASDLIPNDTNSNNDIFVRDRVNNTTELVSVNSSGVPGNDSSNRPSISADGRYVAFDSTSSDLIVGDTNISEDVFVRDLVDGTTELVSVNRFNSGPGFSSSTSPSISADGRYVAFESFAFDLVVGDLNASSDIFVRDFVDGSTELVSVNIFGATEDGSSRRPSISADGRYVAFDSDVFNLIASDENVARDVFVRDRVNNTTELISSEFVLGGGIGDPANNVSLNPSISADGRYVAFQSSATNMLFFTGDSNNTVDVILRDRAMGTNIPVSLRSTGGFTGNEFSVSPAVSANGSFVVFTSIASDLIVGDTNEVEDVFRATPTIPISGSPVGPIVSATLPVSRSVQVGNQATAFASIINTHPSDGALNCTLLPFTDIPADFAFQPTDEMGMLIGEQNQGADIASLNGVQGYVFAYIPTEAFAPTDVEITYDCANTDPAENTVGLNTFLLSASDTPVPDIIGITTVTDLVAAQNTTSLFAVGSTNVGITEDITVNIDTGSTSLPLNLLVCQTNPSTGACLPGSPPSATTTFTYTASSNASFAIFVEPTAAISNDPANNRIFIRFTDGGGTVRGATSTAVRTM